MAKAPPGFGLLSVALGLRFPCKGLGVNFYGGHSTRDSNLQAWPATLHAELLERGFEWTYTRGTAQSTPWFLRPFMPAAPSEPHCD
eukprot:scaffold16194_cov17-Tisochrysis_lutea.AAC.1